MTKSISRRTALRGALSTGTRICIGLPLLEAMVNEHGTALAQSKAPIAPLYVTWFFGNGSLPGLWKPTTTGHGAAWELSPQLRGLAEVKSHLTVVSGLRNMIEGPVHAIGSAASTTGTPMDVHFAGAASIDQELAEFMAGDAPFRSLELGVTPATPSGVMDPLHTVSHNGPNSRNDPEFDPKAVFTRLFGGLEVEEEDRRQRHYRVRKSVLDAVLEDGARLQRKLGSVDRQRLEAHLEAVRAVELRLDEAAATAPSDPTRPRAPTVGIDTGSEAPPEVNSAMVELATLALATEKTRVMTYIFSLPAAHAYFRHLGANMDDDFHDTICHTDPGDDLDDPQVRVDTGVRYTVKCLNEFATSLQRTPHGAGSLLDATLIYATSDIAWGKAHSNEEWPVLFLGKASGRLRGDEHHRFENENLSRALLTVAQAMGSNRQTWGAEAGLVTAPLSGILI